MLPTRIFPLGECAVTVEFGSEMSEHLNDAATNLASYFDTQRFPGYIEAVPAIASTTVFYDLIEVRRSFPETRTAFDAIKEIVEQAAVDLKQKLLENDRIVEVPVSFSEQHALDLPTICETSGLSRENVIEIFLAGTYRVYMLGFLPGFAYMGIVDERIAVPRKTTPRLAVPAGSVGIAGRQTGIYPIESPGGWQIIGRTGLDLIMPDKDPPCLFGPGDKVRFLSQ